MALRPATFVDNALTRPEHVFVPSFAYTVSEYDPAKPWIVISTGRHQVELADAHGRRAARATEAQEQQPWSTGRGAPGLHAFQGGQRELLD